MSEREGQEPAGQQPERLHDFIEVGPFEPTADDVVSNEPPNDDIVEPSVKRVIELGTHEMRKWITRYLLIALSVVLAFGAVAAFVGDKQWERMSAYLNMVLGGLTALTATAVGFYFGSKKFEDESSAERRR
ncbi:hypothetical protein [Cryptosporangium sp. NPDC048952]|uniref:hypothetical protein n=1 Tax=Cryptosporangium sp. NPDC048952 TaxID=3363961 RepID=UPI00371509AA